MKLMAICQKALRQQARDRVGLALTLLTAPLFVLLYWVVFPNVPQPVDACLRDGDPDVVAKLQGSLANHDPPIRLTSCGVEPRDLEVDAPALAERIPRDQPVTVLFLGDATTRAYRVGVPAIEGAIDRWVMDVRGETPRVVAQLSPVAASDQRSPFDLYVPSLLVFAVIMLVFSSAMSVAREVERGTLERLRLTRMRTVDYLAGMSLAQATLGAASVGLSLGVAVLLGFDAAGSIGLAGVVALLTAISCVGVGVVVASWSRTVSQAFVIASAFMFLLVLFSGIVFPVPDSAFFDVLPTVHGVRALHDVLVLGRGAGEVAAPVAKIAGLSAICFVVGWLRFRALHRTYIHGGGQ